MLFVSEPVSSYKYISLFGMVSSPRNIDIFSETQTKCRSVKMAEKHEFIQSVGIHLTFTFEARGCL